jgi:hypothetical protein
MWTMRARAPGRAGGIVRTALSVALLAWAPSASRADAGAELRPTQTVRLDGVPERIVLCDVAGGTPALGASLGRRVVHVGRALAGETVLLDARRCEPPATTRPSVQCTLGRGPRAAHIDVRLTDRARRAGHAVFGERWEYRSLRLRRLVGQEAVSWVDDQVELPPDEVFEDRTVRRMPPPGPAAADACGTGFLVIRSHVHTGAALALYGLSRSGALESLAVSDALGAPERWRDIVGIGDVVGDRKLRVVEVTDPHSAGRLQLSELRDGKFEAVAGLDGYTTHRFGTARQGIGALMDLTGDGIPDIVVPTTDWKCLAAVSAGWGQLRELGRLSCAGASIVDIAVSDINGDGRDDLVALRADGTVEVWTR